jgi:FMN phosphatase YigB (HAD superfamily)
VQRGPAGNQTLSFDVFDTALTRTWFQPSDLFLAVGRELRAAGIYRGEAEHWADERIGAERRLRRALPHTHEEIGLTAIYERLAATLGWPEELRQRALETELAVERAAIRPIATTRAALIAAQSAQRPVIFMSDTYFEQPFVLELLRDSGIEIAADAVYTSLACGRTKRTGTLFNQVLAERGLSPIDLHHTGDNAQADVAAARRIGVQATLFETQIPTRYESRLYEPDSRWPRLLRSAAAGAARAARLSGAPRDARHRLIFETGANVAGPLLTGYVLWVLAEARRRGIARLYFLSRDGQVLQRIAARLNDWLGWGLDLRYLYGSRQALFLPAITQLDDSARAWLFEDAPRASLRALLARADLAPEHEAAWLERAGFGAASWDQPLGSAGAERFRAMSRQADYIQAVEASARARRVLLLAYLEQEGCFEGGRCALVDIGWRGRLQRCLAQVLSATPRPAPALIGFYFGLAERPQSALAGELVAFASASLPNAALLETFVKADHGSVLGFTQDEDDRLVPLLSDSLDQEALDWGIRCQQQGVLEFVDVLLSDLKPDDVAVDVLVGYLRARGRDVFDLFSHFPTPAEAEAFGSLRHAADQTHSRAVDTAPVLARSLLLQLMVQRHQAIESRTIWPEGSIARSLPGELTRRAMQGAWQTRRRLAAALRGRPR